MIRIMSLNPTGYFSYGVHGTIILDNLGLVLLEGENKDRNDNSNGSGKTSLLHSLTQILFGRNPSGENGEKVINRTLKRAFGRVVFYVDGNMWRVSDVKKWRKTDPYPDKNEDQFSSEITKNKEKYHGTDVYLERFDQERLLWIDERSTNSKVGDVRLDLKATREKIVKVLGLNYDQFMSVAYLAQQKQLKFIDGTHKEKLEVLTDIASLGVWNDRLLKVRADLQEKETEKVSLSSKLSGLKQVDTMVSTNADQVQAINNDIIEANNNIIECDKEINKIQELVNQYKLDTVNIEDGIKQLIENTRVASKDKEIAIEKLHIQSGDYSKLYESIRMKPKSTELYTLDMSVAELHGQIQLRKFDMEQMLTGVGKCPRCRSTVTREHIDRQKELLSIEIKEAETKIYKHKEDIERLTLEWQDQIKSEMDAAIAAHELAKQPLEASLKDINDYIDSLNDSLEKLRDNKSKLHDPNRDLQTALNQRMALVNNIGRLKYQLERLTEQQKQYDEYKLAVKETKNKLAILDKDIKLFTLLEKLFGDKGIKSYKLDHIISTLNYILTEHLELLTDGRVRAHITQYRPKADGGIATDIQIMVKEGIKEDIPFNLYSGGEKQQIALAFIGAFWQLSTSYGSGINMLCLDEIFGPLDDFNSQQVFDYLLYLKSKHVSTMLVITHNENIKNQVKFDHIWTIIKTNHVSTVANYNS